MGSGGLEWERPFSNAVFEKIQSKVSMQSPGLGHSRWLASATGHVSRFANIALLTLYVLWLYERAIREFAILLG